jgi:hypothetical protein
MCDMVSFSCLLLWRETGIITTVQYCLSGSFHRNHGATFLAGVPAVEDLVSEIVTIEGSVTLSYIKGLTVGISLPPHSEQF